MGEYGEAAIRKLAKEKNEKMKDRRAEAMKGAVAEALESFCRQDEEFSQAVVQGGEFAECLDRVIQKIKGGHISDLEAYRAAVAYYFPGADIRFQMEIALCPYDAEVEQAAESSSKLLNLEDFL